MKAKFHPGYASARRRGRRLQSFKTCLWLAFASFVTFRAFTSHWNIQLDFTKGSKGKDAADDAVVKLDLSNPEKTSCTSTPGKNCRGDLYMIWSIGVLTTSRPLDFAAKVPRRVQSGQDVQDSIGMQAVYVADPFFFQANGIWYIFSEVLDNASQKGMIGYHLSMDNGTSWSFGDIVLSESWHLSFPYVLLHEGNYYMTTCATAGTTAPFSLWLYVAHKFPVSWTRKIEILHDQTIGRPVDPVLYKDGGTWYLFIFDDGINLERVFMANSLFGPYTEHAKSRQREIRQSGRIFQDDADRIWSFHHTGTDVLKIEIKNLSPTTLEYGSPENVLGPSENLDWASAGMHTLNINQLADDMWVTIVDGWWDDRNLDTHLCLEQRRTICQARGESFVAKESLLKKATTLQQRHGFIYLQLVNEAYLEMTRSWICNAPSGVLSQTLFVATDEASLQGLQQHVQHVALQRYSRTSSGGVDYGHMEYYRLMFFRTKLIEALLMRKINVWLIESDAVWLKDPTPYVLNIHDMDVIAGQDGVLTESIPEGGFIYLNATAKVLEMWIGLRVQLERTLMKHSSEQNIGDAGSEMLMLPRHLHQVNWTFFPREKFVSGLWYDNDEMRQNSSPVVIQNNWIIGNSAKMARAKKWGHWFLKEDLTCKD